MIVFCEPDYTVPTIAVPEVPLLRQCEEWQREPFRSTRARTDMGLNLYRTFRESGVVELNSCGSRRELIDFFAETIRSILPKIDQLGIATREHAEIDSLAASKHRRRRSIPNGSAFDIFSLGKKALTSAFFFARRVRGVLVSFED